MLDYVKVYGGPFESTFMPYQYPKAVCIVKLSRFFLSGGEVLVLGF